MESGGHSCSQWCRRVKQQKVLHHFSPSPSVAHEGALPREHGSEVLLPVLPRQGRAVSHLLFIYSLESKLRATGMEPRKLSGDAGHGRVHKDVAVVSVEAPSPQR